MDIKRKDPLTDVAENLPVMSSESEDKPEGTVVSSDGTRVTLGEKPTHTTAVSSSSAMNELREAIRKAIRECL